MDTLIVIAVLFNSISFLFFFPLVCLIYFLLPFRFRWWWLLGTSYYFYMCWEPVYALLLFASTGITYGAALLIEQNRYKRFRKAGLIGALVANFGILFLFKYFNFVAQSLMLVISSMGGRMDVPHFELLLPVGISFYIFQAVGYLIDVYRGKLKAERHLGYYALFVSFFPQLVAGPIERATHLLPQFREEHRFDSNQAISGIKMMIWGFFMKLCVADRVALYVNMAFNNVENSNGTTLLIASILFAFQIYCDFGGYSSIAIGAARIMGFDLMQNFRRPYLATSIQDFWHRWHISLSTWFKDYLYIPLGGSRVSLGKHIRNLLITFTVSGIWHGANWTFFSWGVLHGVLLVIELLRMRFCPRKEPIGNIRNGIQIIATFACVTMGWIFFRANTLQDALLIIQKIFSDLAMPYTTRTTLLHGALAIGILMIKDFADEYYATRLARLSHRPIIETVGYALLVSLILLTGVFNGGQFIYFQF